MDTINNYNEDNKKVKICKNSCGKSIYWNNNQKAYFEIDDQQKHICHKWKPSINNSQKQFSQHDISVVDTSNTITIVNNDYESASSNDDQSTDNGGSSYAK